MHEMSFMCCTEKVAIIRWENDLKTQTMQVLVEAHKQGQHEQDLLEESNACS